VSPKGSGWKLLLEVPDVSSCPNRQAVDFFCYQLHLFQNSQVVRLDLLAQTNMFQQCSEGVHFCTHGRIADFSQTILLVGVDVAVVKFIRRDIERLAPSLEMNATRIAPKRRGFLHRHILKGHQTLRASFSSRIVNNLHSLHTYIASFFSLHSEQSTFSLSWP
jgi:hypothetical protein